MASARYSSTPFLLVLLGLTVLGSIAWLTNHPDSPWLDRVAEWPGMAGPVASFRAAYGVSPAVSEKEKDPGAPDAPSVRSSVAREAPSSRSSPAIESEAPLRIVEETAAGSEETESIEPPSSEMAVEPLVPPIPPRPRRSPPRGGLTGDVDLPATPWPGLRESETIHEWRWLLPGTPLHAEPSRGQQPSTRLSSIGYLPVLEHEESWAKVAYRGDRWWLDSAWRPAHEGGVRGGVGLASPGSDPDLLRRGRKTLGARRQTGVSELGPYRLLTDVGDGELVSFLAEVAGLVEDAYFARYACQPRGKTRETIVLFDREADYRAYQDLGPEDEFTGWTTGHAGGGVAALFVADRSRGELARTLVHEITHLLNDRCLGTSLPVWLEEGLAGDLGALWIEAALFESMSVAAAEAQLDFVTRGADPSILLLDELRESGRLVSPAVLTSLDRETFYRDGPRRLAYDQSAMLVRYLVDGEKRRHAQAFRAFLAEVVRGRSAGTQLLLDRLELSLDELDARFRRWIEAEARRIRASK